MRDKHHVGTAFVLTLPAVWWAAATIPTGFYRGWGHDPRFYAVYLPGWTIARWLTDVTGDWHGQGFAVALQDGVTALVAALLLALFLARRRIWREHRPIQTAAALLSLTLPWIPMMDGLGMPSCYLVASCALGAGYIGCGVAATVLPVGAALRAALLVIAFLAGMVLAVWRLESWEWLYAGSLLSSLGLAVLLAAKAWLGSGQPQNNQMQLPAHG